MLKIAMILFATSISVTAQWPNRPTPGLVRTPDGKPRKGLLCPR